VTFRLIWIAGLWTVDIVDRVDIVDLDVVDKVDGLRPSCL